MADDFRNLMQGGNAEHPHIKALRDIRDRVDNLHKSMLDSANQDKEQSSSPSQSGVSPLGGQAK